MTETFRTRGFELMPWQQDAVSAWAEGLDANRPFFGTLEIVTGGGKTLIALSCAAAAARTAPGLRLAVVVPTEALAHQWRTVLERYTTCALTKSAFSVPVSVGTCTVIAR